jgi:hypothetical protein
VFLALDGAIVGSDPAQRVVYSVDIDERQLRAELQTAIVELRALGYLTGE